jgi:hypothetical protein
MLWPHSRVCTMINRSKNLGFTKAMLSSLPFNFQPFVSCLLDSNTTERSTPKPDYMCLLTYWWRCELEIHLVFIRRPAPPVERQRNIVVRGNFLQQKIVNRKRIWWVWSQSRAGLEIWKWLDRRSIGNPLLPQNLEYFVSHTTTSKGIASLLREPMRFFK